MRVDRFSLNLYFNRNNTLIETHLLTYFLCHIMFPSSEGSFHIGIEWNDSCKTVKESRSTYVCTQIPHFALCYIFISVIVRKVSEFKTKEELIYLAHHIAFQVNWIAWVLQWNRCCVFTIIFHILSSATLISAIIRKRRQNYTV